MPYARHPNVMKVPRALLLAAGAALSPSLAASAQPATQTQTALPATTLPGRADFISPAGEPVHSHDALSGAEHWFEAVDTDRDGRLTLAEVQADAARFFDSLDVDHDGELGSNEIERYETQVAPEVGVLSTNTGYTSGGGGDDAPKEAPYPDRIGAGRYGYIDLPEPIIAMDANFDRGISRSEFRSAMEQRFALLDLNHDGAITRDELPKITPGRAGDGHRDRGGTRDRGGRGDGGRHAGGFGGGLGSDSGMGSGGDFGH